MARIEELRHIPIRLLKVVVDTEDVFAPELPLSDFVKTYGKEPEPPRYRVISLEVCVCPEDRQPVLVNECGLCPKFVRRFQGYLVCKGVSYALPR